MSEYVCIYVCMYVCMRFAPHLLTPPPLQGGNTISFYANLAGGEGWVIPGEGLLFEELAANIVNGVRVHPEPDPDQPAAETSAATPTKPVRRPPGRGPPKEEEKKEAVDEPVDDEGPPKPTVNMKVVRNFEQSMQLSHAAIVNRDGEVIGSVRGGAPSSPFLLFTGDGVRWRKVAFSEPMEAATDRVWSVQSLGGGRCVCEMESGKKWNCDARENQEANPEADALVVKWTEAAALVPGPLLSAPLDKKGAPRRRKKRAIKMEIPPAIPTPPAAPTINKCVSFKVDSCLRVVKAHYLPGFKELLKKPVSEQNAKDSKTILEYVTNIMQTEGVTYFPSGVTMESTNPWEGDLEMEKKLGGITVCSICNGAEANHEGCIRNHKIAEAGMLQYMLLDK